MAVVSNSLTLADGTVPTSVAARIDLVSSSRFRSPGWVTATWEAVVAELRPTVTAGQWSEDLIPNSDITPSGTVYRVTEFVGKRRYTSYIRVTADGGSVRDLLVDHRVEDASELAAAGVKVE